MIDHDEYDTVRVLVARHLVKVWDLTYCWTTVYIAVVVTAILVILLMEAR